jgi:hypothetical protein
VSLFQREEKSKTEIKTRNLKEIKIPSYALEGIIKK